MKVLIVEDDDFKRDALLAHLRERNEVALVDSKMSFQSGLRAVLDTTPDLIILDMSIPTFDHTGKSGGGRVRAFGGYDFLYELDRRKIRTKVIVVTQFDSFGSGSDKQTLDEVSEKLRRDFHDLFVDAVFYQASESRWKMVLTQLLDGMQEETIDA